MEDDEKVVELKDVLDFLVGAALVLSDIVGVFALIWADWQVFRVFATVAWVVAILEAARVFFGRSRT